MSAQTSSQPPANLADNFTGSDCGDQVNEAFRSGLTVVQVTPKCAQAAFITPVSITNANYLYFLPGIYSLSAQIAVTGMSAGVIGPETSDIAGNAGGAAILRVSSSSSLGTALLVTGQSNVVANIVVDSNGTSTVGLTVQGVRTRVDNSSFTGSTGAGIVIGSTDEKVTAQRLQNSTITCR